MNLPILPDPGAALSCLCHRGGIEIDGGVASLKMREV